MRFLDTVYSDAVIAIHCVANKSVIAGLRDGRERSFASDRHWRSVAGRGTRRHPGGRRCRLVRRSRHRNWCRRRRQRPGELPAGRTRQQSVPPLCRSGRHHHHQNTYYGVPQPVLRSASRYKLKKNKVRLRSNLVGGYHHHDLTSIWRPFDCLSKVIKVTVT